MTDKTTVAGQANEQGAPFLSLPSSTAIADYFWHRVVRGEQDAPYRRGQYHGAEGINLWRDGSSYCYLWVDATVDHDMWMAYLLEVRTNTGEPGGFAETRDHLYLAAGADGLFEVVERHRPSTPFQDGLDDSIEHHHAAMLWFVERDLATVKDRAGLHTPFD